jgi:hypothetical protein
MRKYSKPALFEVKLIADQTTAVSSCKTAALAPGPLPQYGGADCETGTGQQCFAIGSGN